MTDTPQNTFDTNEGLQMSEKVWEDSIIPALMEYIKVPCLSPAFDAEWEKSGHMETATKQFVDWAESFPITGKTVTRHDLPGRTPLIMIEVEGESEDTVLMYGHLDKQPEFEGWSEDLGPWKPVRKGEKLYGRGSVDDGYAMFMALLSVRLLQEQGLPHQRIVIMIEASEESGSPDLPAYFEHLRQEIGSVSLIVCLDSLCGNYEQLWDTTSLRGIAIGDLTVKVLTEGVHSGGASGIVTDSGVIASKIVASLTDEYGTLLHERLQAAVPELRTQQAKAAGDILGWEGVVGQFPLIDTAFGKSDEMGAYLTRNAWCSSLTVVGAAGIPQLSDAGNVMRPETTLRLSVRIPPTVDWTVVETAINEHIEKMNFPAGIDVTFSAESGGNGWHAPLPQEWFAEAVQSASQSVFNKPAMAIGIGGSIPFMGMLGEMFPEAQFLITGVLGPEANAHGPNEFLHIEMSKQLTVSISHVLHAHAVR